MSCIHPNSGTSFPTVGTEHAVPWSGMSPGQPRSPVLAVSPPLHPKLLPGWQQEEQQGLGSVQAPLNSCRNISALAPHAQHRPKQPQSSHGGKPNPAPAKSCTHTKVTPNHSLPHPGWLQVTRDISKLTFNPSPGDHFFLTDDIKHQAVTPTKYQFLLRK